MLYNFLGKNKEAIDVLQTAIESQHERGELNYALGLLLAETGDFSAAKKYLKKATVLLPRNARIHYNYALALQHDNETEQALAALLKSYDLDPSDSDIVYALSILSLQQKKYLDALRYAKELQKLIPNSPIARRLLKTIQARNSSKN